MLCAFYHNEKKWGKKNNMEIYNDLRTDKDFSNKTQKALRKRSIN